MNEILIWNYGIPKQWLSKIEIDYLIRLPKELPAVDWIFDELDRVWNEHKLDNCMELSQQPIGAYYGHPVWPVNGIFSSQDPASLSHRSAVAKYLKEIGVKSVADYGGGFGQLAISIAKAIPDADIYIVEPYPTKVGIERLRRETQIKIVPNLSVESYGAIVAQDVLEHVEDPIKLASEIANSVRVGSSVIFANCFYPVIQCHLPSTFHLRYTFPYVMKSLGLRYVGTVEGAAHAQIFERVGALHLSKARKVEALSRIIGPLLNYGRGFLSKVKRFLMHE